MSYLCCAFGVFFMLVFVGCLSKIGCCGQSPAIAMSFCRGLLSSHQSELLLPFAICFHVLQLTNKQQHRHPEVSEHSQVKQTPLL